MIQSPHVAERILERNHDCIQTTSVNKCSWYVNRTSTLFLFLCLKQVVLHHQSVFQQEHRPANFVQWENIESRSRTVTTAGAHRIFPIWTAVLSAHRLVYGNAAYIVYFHSASSCADQHFCIYPTVSPHTLNNFVHALWVTQLKSGCSSWIHLKDLWR